VIDVLVIGGGINGAGIARDAAGRGLSTLLVERADLASATSSSSSKLIHGGLRYLEHYEFRLVAESLAERETLLRVAGHLVWPIRFLMPHVPELRPRWMIRLGLFLYDHLARRSLLPASTAVRLSGPYGSGLRADLKHGFLYSDCRVDDARLVVANAMDVRLRGGRVLNGVECLAAKRISGGWRARLSNGEEIETKAIVNMDDRRYVLDGPVAVLGRSRSCDCVFSDPNVSREHAELRRGSTGDWQVIDLGSTNGIKVNDRRVDRSRLSPGDEVTLGTTRFTFDIEQ
jgi:NADPH-dependent 2,4-dienoyl-CoA reductase/sulfur reductase-like enzyme